MRYFQTYLFVLKAMLVGRLLAGLLLVNSSESNRKQSNAASSFSLEELLLGVKHIFERVCTFSFTTSEEYQSLSKLSNDKKII